MSEPIRDLETAVREVGALPVPVGFEPPMTSEQRAVIDELIGDAKPATARLLEQLAGSVRDIREHEHPKWEDLYCQNLLMWLGERMGPVLRSLLDAEDRIERRRARLVALQNDAMDMRGSLSPNGEDRKVPFPLGQTLTPAVDWLIARVAELEAELRIGPPWTCPTCSKENRRDVCVICETDRPDAEEDCDHPNGYGPNGCAGCGAFAPAGEDGDAR